MQQGLNGSVLRAGYPPQYCSFNLASASVASGQYDNFLYCLHCNYAKPPQAHHCRCDAGAAQQRIAAVLGLSSCCSLDQSMLFCRKCGKCVMDMDHHCFFLNNCVGRTNLRAFLLFLEWVLLGSLYIIAGVLCLLFNRRDEILRCVGPPGYRTSMLALTSQIYHTVLIAPGWLQTCVFMLTSATAGAFGSASMLKSQYALHIAGRTYISILKKPSFLADHRISAVQMLKLLAEGILLSSVQIPWSAHHTQAGNRRV